MRLDEALSDVEAIRGQLGRLQVATCYRSATTAASGTIALLAAALQPGWVAPQDASLRADFGIVRPVIAVLSLNPHGGDDGRIGDEDIKVVRPAVEQAKENGILAMGPFPADGFFGTYSFQKYDVVLAMYHDQGLIPVKTLAFGRSVNVSLGLPIVRTSVDHGTALDLAGTGRAKAGSLRTALRYAEELASRVRA